MSSCIAIGFSNCLGNFLIMTAALKILRERGNDNIFMITDSSILDKHPAVKALAEKMFDGIVTRYKKHDFDKIYVGNWSRPKCMIKNGDVSETPVWWTDQSFDSGSHEVQTYLNMINAVNSDFSGFMTEVADEPILNGKKPRIVLANASKQVGSRQGSKIGWLKFPELSKSLIDLNYEVVLVGQGDELRGCSGLNLVDKLDIFETAKVISQCDLMVSTDTGLMHLADSLNVPIVVLAGPTPMTKAHPLISNFRVVRSFISCAPCYQSTLWNLCNDYVCMKNIKVDDVLKAIFSYKLNEQAAKKVILPPFVDETFTSLQEQGKRSLKIVAPYYEGDARIDTAINTWPMDVLVLAITDENTVAPDGYESFLTSDNAKKRKLSNKTKPIITDLLKRLLALYPNQDFYGYINSDIVLPPGVDVSLLLPSKGYQSAAHHRLEVADIVNGKRGGVYWSGKDCFIWPADVTRLIASKYPECVLGAACWDDGLVHWLWKNCSQDSVELRYREIWHVRHTPGWTGGNVDDKYNNRILAEAGISTALRHSYDWKLRYTEWQKYRKKIGIVQPGKIGDILIVLPIAKWYADRGYEILWPVYAEYLPLFEYVDYVTTFEIPSGVGQGYQKALAILKNRVGKSIDLGVGLGRDETDWLASGLSFDRWKYKEAKVPFSEKRNLQIIRNKTKEDALKAELNLSEDYTVTHSHGCDAGNFDFKKNGAVEVRKVDGYCLFDWIGILEQAKDVYCIDSCIMNLLENLNLCKEKRYYNLGTHTCNASRVRLLAPNLSSDWHLIESENSLPVVFSTIVFNGMPYIEYHLEKFQKLPFPWHWYIIEGLAEIAGDPGADGHRARGGRIPTDFNHHLSVDGTTEYLDKISMLDNVTVIRNDGIWPSKLDMVNAPIPLINYNCLLWQIDVDEFYPHSSILDLHNLFVSQPDKTAAIVPHIAFMCKTKHVVSKGTWGGECFPRVWRFEPGCKWKFHEPPVLINAEKQDLDKLNPFQGKEVEHLGYHHYGYVHPSQIRFKESYYGYKNLYDGWVEMSKTKGKIKVRDFLICPGINDAIADDFKGKHLIPVEQWTI